MAQTICYVFRYAKQWKIRLNEKQFGPYSRRDSTIDIAVQAARLVATHSPDGAEVRVADENLPGKWHIAWSVWSANRANAA